MLTRSRGDFEEILERLGPDRRADRRHRARARVRARGDAGRQARRLRQQAAARPARRGAVGDRARARRAAALRGRGGRRRAGDPRAAGVARGRPRRAHPRHRQRHDQLHPHPRWPRAASPTRTRWPRAQELGYAEADPTDDVTGRDAAAKMAILARLAFSTPVHLDQVVYEGIEHITADDMAFARELGLGLKLIGTAERVDGGISVRVHPAFLYAGHPLACVTARSTRSRSSPTRSPRSRCPAPARAARRRRAPCSATSISAMIPPASTPETTEALEIVDDVESRVLPAPWRSPTGPACSPRSPRCWGCRARRSSRSSSAAWASNARLVMVAAPAAGVALLRRRAR